MDRQAIEELYRTHGHIVLRRALYLLRNEEEAHEVLHDVFASMLNRPVAFRADSSVTTWLYSATTHGCLNHLRNRKTQARLLEMYRAPMGSTCGNAENVALVHDLLERIPEELGQAAIYYYVDEMTHEEIGQVLGCSRRHVGDLIERFHQHVRLIQEAS